MKSDLSIDLRHLRYFIKAAEHGSFRKAAFVLNIQESSISRRIRDLEDQLGASLFNRRSSGVALTLAGQRFLCRARMALRQIDNGAKDVASIGRIEDGLLKIGVISSLASGFLLDMFNVFERTYAGISIDFVDGGSVDHLISVQQSQLDVAFVAGAVEWPECRAICLWSERIFAVLPREHRLARRVELKWSDLVDEKFIVSSAAPGPEVRDLIMRRLTQGEHYPSIRSQQVGRDNLLSLVAVGHGLTLIGEAATGLQFPGVAYCIISGECLPISIVWSTRNDNPACFRLLSLARTMARSLGQA